MKPGRSLEKLVAYLERHFAASDAVTVESPKRLIDKTTGKKREHDVILNVKSGHHKMIVSIECRDRSRPVGVPQVEAFAKKCSETLVDKGVIVSPCGFTSTALTKSKALGIRCLSIDQVETLPWTIPNLEMSQIHSLYKHFDFKIIPEEDFKSKPKAFEILDENGNLVAVENLRNSIFNAIKDHGPAPENQQAGESTQKFKIVIPNLTIIDKDTGVAKNVKYIDTVVKIETTITKTPFVLQEYKAAAGKEAIAELAIANLDFGRVKGRMVINHKLEKGGEIAFIPDADKPKKSNRNK